MSSRCIQVDQCEVDALLNLRAGNLHLASCLRSIASKMHPLEGDPLYAAAAWFDIVNRELDKTFGVKVEARDDS